MPTLQYFDGTKWIDISGSGSGGTTDYTALTNKPSVNNVTLTGNKTPAQLGLAQAAHTHTKSEVTDFPTAVSAFTNDAGYLTAHQDISGKISEPASEGTSGQVLTTDGNGGRNWTNGTASDYSALINKPSVNGTTLDGNKNASQLGLAAASHSHAENDITDLTNDLAGKASLEHTHLTTDITDLSGSYVATPDNSAAYGYVPIASGSGGGYAWEPVSASFHGVQLLPYPDASTGPAVGTRLYVGTAAPTNAIAQTIGAGNLYLYIPQQV